MARTPLGLLLVVALALVAWPAAAQDARNVTCRLDALAEGAAAGATVDCLQLAPEIYGEFDADVTVTLQRRTADGWADVAVQRCTGRSEQGVLVLPCTAAGEGAAGEDVRGLVDLAAPLDWRPAAADPRYSGGNPPGEPLAVDACDVAELTDGEDLTLPDAPWADLCAVHLDSQLDDAGDLASLTVRIGVAGLAPDALTTTTWRAELVADGSTCAHEVEVHDDVVAGIAAALHTRCDGEPQPCGPLFELITDLTGGSCSSGTLYDRELATPLPAERVAVEGDAVLLTLLAEDLPADVLADLAPDVAVAVPRATSLTWAGAGVVDVDTARGTGAVHRIGQPG